MKKLMMAVAIVCAAVGVQAATVQWSTGALKGPKSVTDGAVGSTAINKTIGEWVATVYFYDSTGEKLLGSDSTKMTVAAKEGGGTTVTYAGSEGASVTWGLQTGIQTQKNYDFLALNTDYIAKITVEGTTADYTANKTSATMALHTESADAGVAPWKGASVSGWSTQAWTVAAVPEPTSAMLVLLGVAGLALRRRRA